MSEEIAYCDNVYPRFKKVDSPASPYGMWIDVFRNVIEGITVLAKAKCF